MAAEIVNSRKLIVTFTLQNSAGDKVEREVSLDNAYEGTAYEQGGDAYDYIGSLREMVITNGATTKLNKFVQPANWRDSDTAEEVWTTTAINFTHVEQTKTINVDEG